MNILLMRASHHAGLLLCMLLAWSFQCPTLLAAADDQKILKIVPKEPAEAAKTFQLPKGFRMDLIAQEPLIMSPVAIAYDENGNLYVAEMVAFPFPQKASAKLQGQVRLLKDSDGDGIFDLSSVFADNLLCPSSVICWKEGVFVAALGDIWYFKDTNGDGKADVRRKVFTGFGPGSLEYMQNNLAWGIDHKIYGSAGPNGGNVKPNDRSDAKPVSLAGRDFCFDPVTGDLEAISGGGSQWGNAFDDSYNRFVCKNIIPARHIILPLQYLARNPYVRTAQLYHPLTSEEGDVAVYRASPPEPWRTVRARLRQELGKNANPGEINDAGYFTAACGITVYRGTAYPPSYHGNLFVAEPAGNLVHRRSLIPEGVSFRSRRVDENTEVIASSDNFFRPVALVNAPDGTLHIVDMYREVVEDPKYVPPELMKSGEVNVEGGWDRGRIYRLTPPNFTIPKPPRLKEATAAALVAQLENPNAWWRETAQRLIYERQQPAAIKPLRKLLARKILPQTRLHALWSLEGLKALRAEDIAAALTDPSPAVREHAIRLAERHLGQPPKLLAKLLPLANDAEAKVRFQLAFTLGENPWTRWNTSLPVSGRTAATDKPVVLGLAEIARRDADDAWIRSALLSSSVECADRLLEILLKDPKFLEHNGARTLLKELAFIVGKRQCRDEADRVLGTVATAPATRERPRVQASIVVALGNGLGHSNSNLLNQFFSDKASPTGEMLNQLLSNAESIATDSLAPTEARQDAIALLGYGNVANVQESLLSLVEPQQPQEVQLAAVRGLLRDTRPEVATSLMRRWRSSAPAVQGEILDALLTRKEWINLFLEEVETEAIPRAMISLPRRATLTKHPDPSIRDRAMALFSETGLKSRAEVLERYRPALSGQGDRNRGRKVFEKSCVPCHRFAGQGNEIGPNLSAYGQASTSSEKLLIAILDPNREVAPDYVGYEVELKDARVLTGIIGSQTPHSIVLKQPGDGQAGVILRNDIKEMRSSSLSLMPEGLEESIKPEEMADLLEFLMAIRGGI